MRGMTNGSGAGSLAAGVLAALLGGAGGVCAFLLVYMRALNPMTRRGLKKRLALLAFLVLPLGPALAGLRYGPGPWLLAPAAFLAAHVALEAAAAARARRTRGSAPVETRPPARARRFLTNRDLYLRRYEIAAPGPGWPARLRLAHLSDLHVNDRMPAGYYRDLARRVTALAPDLLLFTGDFVYVQRGSRLLDETLAALAAPLGRYAVLGNHDYATGADAVAAQLAAHGIRVLRGGETARLALPGGARLAVAGQDAPWGPPAPAPRAADGETLLVLSHSPDNAPALARAGAFAVFAGHYHGGQVRWLVIGPAAVPSRHGRWLVHGHHVLDTTHVFVSAGAGYTFPPFRIRCPPDVLLVDVLGLEAGGAERSR
jgi:predicted MPP superfamily phosphohydrolase